MFTGSETWLGLHSDDEITRNYRPKQWVRQVVPAQRAKVFRRFFRGDMDPEMNENLHHILAMTPLNDEAYFDAALLRPDSASEPFRLRGPGGAVMLG